MPLSTDGLVIAASDPIDLQMHTVLSDGKWTPEALLDHLAFEGFALAAFTDHERPDVAESVQALAIEKRMPLLVATEISTTWNDGATDILCFGFDPSHPAINEIARDVLRRQRENTAQAAENLRRDGYPISADELDAIISLPSTAQPSALVACLERHGYGSAGNHAGYLAGQAGCTFMSTDIGPAVEAMHASGGLCIVAHPGRGSGFTRYAPDLLDKLRRQIPFDGIETNYPKHTPEQTAIFREYAQKHGLLTSSGSDSHSTNQLPIKYPAGLSRALLERLGVTVV